MLKGAFSTFPLAQVGVDGAIRLNGLVPFIVEVAKMTDVIVIGAGPAARAGVGSPTSARSRRCRIDRAVERRELAAQHERASAQEPVRRWPPCLQTRHELLALYALPGRQREGGTTSLRLALKSIVGICEGR